MTVLALGHPTRDRPAAAPDSMRSRFGRDVRGDRVSGTMTQLEQIRALLERDAYTVDAAMVADAIVERLLAGRSVRGTLSR